MQILMKKQYNKLLHQKNNLLIIGILLIAACFRLYNFPERIIFWSEQARSLMVSYGYLDKFTLLGQEYFRQNSYGHTIYSGALFNYILLPFALIFKGDVLTITLLFAFINLAACYLTFVVGSKISTRTGGIIASVLMSFNSMMVYHSLFIWNYNLLPLVGLGVIYWTWLFLKNKAYKNIFIVGIVSGLGLSLQPLFLVYTVFILSFLIIKSANKFKTVIYYFAGLILLNLPAVIFDLRHDFFQLRTIAQYFLETLNGVTGQSFSYYYLLPIFPVLATLGGVVLQKTNKLLRLSILLGYVALNFYLPGIDFNKSLGMPEGLSLRDIEKTAEVIKKDATKSFNVAEVLDFDKRAYVLRYLLQYQQSVTPLPETEYANLDTLYVLSTKDYNFGSSTVWELKASNFTEAQKLADVGEGYAVYKLTK